MKRQPWWKPQWPWEQAFVQKEHEINRIINQRIQQGYSLDQEKIVKSSYSEVTTTATSSTTMKTLADYLTNYGQYKLQYLGNTGNIYGLKNSYTSGGGVPYFSSVFGCCGATAMTGCGGSYLTSRELREEFVELLVQGGKQTIYFLPTTTQMKMFKDKESSVLHLLFALGAKEVHANPNRIHGPNKLHLCVLDRGDPEFLKIVYEKYLTKVKFKDNYGYTSDCAIPRFVAELLEKDAPKKAPAVERQARDKNGRFVTVVK